MAVLYQISLSHETKNYWLLNAIQSWKIVSLKFINLSPMTLYSIHLDKNSKIDMNVAQNIICKGRFHIGQKKAYIFCFGCFYFKLCFCLHFITKILPGRYLVMFKKTWFYFKPSWNCHKYYVYTVRALLIWNCSWS